MRKFSYTKLTLLVFAVLCIAGFAFFSVAQENSSSSKNIFMDSDQDGLSDDEEKAYGTDVNNRDTDGDGYTDGVEVRSGYNPLKPAPGDKIITEKNAESIVSTEETENLTEELSIQVANLINTSSKEEQEIKLEDLDTIIEQATSEALTFEDLPEIDEEGIKIKEQNYSSLSEEKRKEKEKKDALEYLTAVSYILVSNSPKSISTVKDVENLANEVVSEVELFSLNLYDISYFEDLANKGETVLEQLKEIEVPEKFLDIHIDGIKLANYAISLKDEAKPDPADPIATIANLSGVQQLINLSIDLSENITSELSNLGISEIPIDL